MEAKGAKKDGQQKEQQKGQAVKKNKNKMSGESAVRPKAQKSHDQHAKHLKGHHHHRNMQQKQQQKQQKQDNMFKAQTNGHGHHHHDKNCHHDKDEGCIVYKTITIVPTYPQTRTAPSCAQPTNELGSQVPLYLAGGDEEMDQGLEEDVSAVDEEFDDEAEAERDEGDGGIAEKLFKQQPVQDGRFEFLRRT
ncbi:MAG: hypothetical protein J3Q66DRAFT_339058 [Benniella sp.]|nr:MAG: hypothetical protein J3Q66DRAFT_339058 [Benniella sp.]